MAALLAYFADGGRGGGYKKYTYTNIYINFLDNKCISLSLSYTYISLSLRYCGISITNHSPYIPTHIHTSLSVPSYQKHYSLCTLLGIYIMSCKYLTDLFLYYCSSCRLCQPNYICIVVFCYRIYWVQNENISKWFMPCHATDSSILIHFMIRKDFKEHDMNYAFKSLNTGLHIHCKSVFGMMENFCFC